MGRSRYRRMVTFFTTKMEQQSQVTSAIVGPVSQPCRPFSFKNTMLFVMLSRYVYKLTYLTRCLRVTMK